MAKENIGDKLNDYYDLLEKEKRPRSELMRDVAKFVSPTRAINTEMHDNPDQVHLNEDVYDGKAVSAARTMVDGMFGHSCSPASNWADMNVTRDGDSVREAEEYTRNAMRIMMERWRSGNFYTAAYQFINDGVHLGNGALMSRARGQKMYYKALNPFHWFFAEDDYGEMTMFIYRFQMSAQEAVASLPKVSDEVKREAEDNPTGKTWYMYVVIERDLAASLTGKSIAKMPEYSVYVKELKGNEILKESRFESNPISLWLYRKNSGEKYGRGPGDDAYQDLQYTNQLSQSIMEGQQLRAAPPMIAGHEAKAYGLKYQPKRINYYSNPDRKPEFMTVGGDYMSSMDLLTRRDQIIEFHFMVDFWTMLSRATNRQTAYEVSEKQGERLALIAYPIQNFFSSLNGTLERSLDMAIKNNIVPKPGRWAQGTDLRFVFNGFLAQSQRRAVEGQGMLQAFNEIAPLLQMDPQAMIVLNSEEFIRKRFDVNNVPTSLLRTKDEVKKIKEAQAQQAAAQQKTEQAAEVGKASNNTTMDDMKEMLGG